MLIIWSTCAGELEQIVSNLTGMYVFKSKNCRTFFRGIKISEHSLIGWIRMLMSRTTHLIISSNSKVKCFLKTSLWTKTFNKQIFDLI